MPNRSYGQFCALAQALDRVGDRWTLLLIRDLLAGPARFRDLRASLPGLATNLLTQRLRALEEFGLVTLTKLPPPAGVAVYQLTDRGRGLQPALDALARWGMGFMRAAKYCQPGTVRSLVNGFRVILSGRVQPDDQLRLTLRIAEQDVACTIGEGNIELSLGPQALAQAQIRCDYPIAFGFIGGADSFCAAIDRGDAQLTGAREAAAKLDQIRARANSATAR